LSTSNGPLVFRGQPGFRKVASRGALERRLRVCAERQISFDVTKVFALGWNITARWAASRTSAAGTKATQIMPVVDLNLSPEWEFNFGVGVGLTPNTDDLLIKLIVGRRF
jgi:hypothetical protein